MVPHYVVKTETPKMHVNKNSPFNAALKRFQHIFVRNFIENQHFFMLFSLLYSIMIGTCTDMNFTHRT